MIKEKEKTELRGIVRYVYKTMGHAIADYHMLTDKDRLLIAVSGGMDSLSLLKLFQMRQARIPIDFEILACFIDTDFIKVDKQLLLDYFDACAIPYVVKRLTLGEGEVNCFWCSWNRRKLLFETAREHNCNKISFGHNLDDIIETTLMNLLFNGEISTMKPKVELFGGQITVIRPLCYLEKRLISRFASQFSFPDTQYECVYGKDSGRAAVQDLIKNLQKHCRGVKKNIFYSLTRIRQEYLLSNKNPYRSKGI